MDNINKIPWSTSNMIFSEKPEEHLNSLYARKAGVEVAIEKLISDMKIGLLSYNQIKDKISKLYTELWGIEKKIQQAEGKNYINPKLHKELDEKCFEYFKKDTINSREVRVKIEKE